MSTLDTTSQGAVAHPKPLMCRLAALLAEWRQTRDNMKARGEDDAAIAVECCMETLHQDVAAFFREMKAWREHCVTEGNTQRSVSSARLRQDIATCRSVTTAVHYYGTDKQRLADDIEWALTEIERLRNV